jgi:hypothetical protein
MIPFSNYMTEEKASKEQFGGLAADPKGKLHELLVGYHLRGGQHLDKHPDVEGKTPKQVHDEIAKQLGGTRSLYYRNFSERARKSSEHIKQQLGLTDKDVANVQWTSKAGDMKRATGIDASQKEDDSDIVITDKSGKHHGVSLKVSDDNKPITLSNNGKEATYGGDKILETHKKDILQTHKGLSNLTNAGMRKEWLKSNPKAQVDIKKRNLQTLTNVAKNMHEKISTMSPEQRANHVRHLVLHAYSTPKEAQGHAHIRHFTGGGLNPDMHVSHPGKDHEFILNDPKNITTKHSGTSVYYHYKGVPFAMQTAKFSSQSDPLSSLVVVGKEVARKQDKSLIDGMRQEHEANKVSQTEPEIQPGPVSPTADVTSQHIISNHPSLKKKLSDYRPQKTQSGFTGFLKTKAQQTPAVGGFAAIKKPGIQKPINPNEHKQYASDEHSGFKYRSPGDMA